MRRRVGRPTRNVGPVEPDWILHCCRLVEVLRARSAVIRNAFVWLGLYLAAIVLVGGLLAWLLSIVLGATLDASFHRVLSRTLALTALIGVLLSLRATGGLGRAAVGFGADRRTFLQTFAVHVAIGLLAIAPLVVMLFVTGVREWAGPSDATPDQVVSVLPLAVLTGFTVGLLEETYFRGFVMLAALRRGHAASALIATSLFFAILHFLVPREEIEAARWYSGFEIVAGGLSDLNHAATLGSFVALTVAGLLLGVMRLRHGHIGSCAGFHAGWVIGYTLTHRLTDVTTAGRSAWLIGPDGVMGWLAFAWVGALSIAYLASIRSASRATDAPV